MKQKRRVLLPLATTAAAALAFWPLMARALGPDFDGDGVADEFDDCPNTPAATLVDAAGRPMGDLDGDCDADLADFDIFSQSVTGPLPPWTSEVCDDGLDNDDDQLVDCGDVDNCPVGAACDQGLHCSQFQTCGCPPAYGDCDGNAGNGCETLLNDNPACDPAFLGFLSGDTGAGQLQVGGAGEAWYRVRLTEDNNDAVYLSATVQLLSAPGTDYDLFLRCAACGTSIVASSTTTAPYDLVYPRWEDDWGESDTLDLIIEVRWYSGACGDYTLTVFGNTDLSAYPNTCNP